MSWNTISPQEASQMLFKRILELIIRSVEVSSDTTVKLLAQRLYGDYRLVKQTAEYKRAKKTLFYFRNTGLGKELM